MQAYKTTVSTPFVEPTLNIPILLQVTLRLAQILAEEVDLLQESRVKEIAALQDEKLQLVTMLEAQKQMIERKPELIAQMHPEDREELREVVELFEEVMHENHRRLRVARDVNEAIVGAIREAISEQHVRGLYSGRGVAHINHTPISVTLDNVV